MQELPSESPSALASLLLEITHPSLFDRMTIGFLSNFGLKTSHKKHKNYYNQLMQTFYKTTF